ncbi:protein kinase [Sphaerisporangium sp. NPDC049002]|uniref:serine/threonine-protein kinase n=1 Tax=unclassified Sphaerisporangium TaxID=2630420 RepID=UPI0033D61E05
MAAGPLQPGDPRALGAFQVVGRLGEGGQGVVYEGLSAYGDRVAIKVLKGGTDPDTRRRLAREMESARRVAPFCTARVLAAELDRADPFVVSEFVAGPSLQDRVRDGGPLRDGDVERLAVGTASALAAIHGAGVVHRDFKPANVLLGPDGPRVVDFGIARPLDASTAPSVLAGTPPYMAPEQLKGVHASPAADVFAWAATMVYAATGRAPFGSDTIAAVFNRLLNHEPDLSGVPQSLLDTLATCLSKDPQVRPSARSLLVRLVDPTASTVSVPEVGAVPSAYVPPDWPGLSAAGQATVAPGPGATKVLPADPTRMETSPLHPSAGAPAPAPTIAAPYSGGVPTGGAGTAAGDTASSGRDATPSRAEGGRRGRSYAMPVIAVAAAALVTVATAGVLYATGTLGHSTEGGQASSQTAAGTAPGRERTSGSSSAPAATTEGRPSQAASGTTADREPTSGPTPAPPAARGGGIPAGFAGTWAGQVESTDGRKDQAGLTITLKEGQSTATLTRDDCRQEAMLTSVTSATVLQLSVQQHDLCAGGDVTLTLKDPGTLDYVGQEGASAVEYRGNLHRS